MASPGEGRETLEVNAMVLEYGEEVEKGNKIY